MDSRCALVGTVFLVLLGTGCSRSTYDVADVDGVLLIKGQPANKVRVEFVPEMGVEGPSSSAETDAQGRFTLHIMERDGSSPPGAVVGRHKVTLHDLQLAESETGVGVPIRIDAEYSQTSSTPLAHDVQPGKQTIQLEVP